MAERTQKGAEFAYYLGVKRGEGARLDRPIPGSTYANWINVCCSLNDGLKKIL